MDICSLEKLRPLGKIEQFSSARHHLGFYNNVGVSAHYTIHEASTAFNLYDTVFRVVADVIQNHPILSAIPVDEDTPNPYFARLPVIDLCRAISFVTRSQELLGRADMELDALLQEQHNTDFKAEYGTLPFWRVIVVQTPGLDTEFTACFIFHHSLGDGASGLLFHASFLTALNNTIVPSTFVPEEALRYVKSPDTSLLPSLEALHPLPIPLDSPKSMTPHDLDEWTGKPIQLPCTTRFRSLSLSVDASTAFIKQCKKKGARITSALPALMASILFIIVPPTTESLTCVIPVSLRRWLPSEIITNAMGVWIDAFKVQFPRAKTEETSKMDWWQAQQCQNAIKTYLSHGGQAINVARFKNMPNISSIFTSKIGQARESAFEVSNLGVFSSDTNDDGWNVGRIVFSRSAFASGSAIAIGVVTGGDGGICLGFTWQEGIVGKEVVERIIDRVQEALMSESEGE